jgi:preprotein translocase subunit SecD
MLGKRWKLLFVVGVLIWSVVTLFRLIPQTELDRLQHLANLPPCELQDEVVGRLSKMPGWEKMNNFEHEDALKRAFEEAQYANNIQVLAAWNNPALATIPGLKEYQNGAVITNLKLGLDLRGGSQLLLQALPSPAVPEITPEVMRGVETVINNRVNSLGVSETVVQRAGADRLIVELPGVKDPQQAKDRIGTTALLEFKELDAGPDGRPVWKDVGLTGAEFKHAQAVPMVSGGTWRILFEFKPDGAKKFGDLTSRLVGRQIGIFLDGQPTERGVDGRPLPVDQYHGITVREPILGGNGEITGNFTKDQAVDLSVKLNAGALPVPVKILQERTVGATLGQDSIHKSLVAGLVGIALVMIFMLVVYGLSGLVADTALVLYTLTTMAVFQTIPVTLTLAGIAGFILSIGMAVDANILIFERTKEELKSGKNLHTAIEVGFSRAFSAIFDSNVNSLIACAVLILFGTSIVKGFAITLAIGVLVSMFSAIFASRELLHLLPRKLGLFGVKYERKAPKLVSKEAL